MYIAGIFIFLVVRSAQENLNCSRKILHSSVRNLYSGTTPIVTLIAINSCLNVAKHHTKDPLKDQTETVNVHWSSVSTRFDDIDSPDKELNFGGREESFFFEETRYASNNDFLANLSRWADF